jgi:hypothetical protein
MSCSGIERGDRQWTIPPHCRRRIPNRLERSAVLPIPGRVSVDARPNRQRCHQLHPAGREGHVTVTPSIVYSIQQLSGNRTNSRAPTAPTRRGLRVGEFVCSAVRPSTQMSIDEAGCRHAIDISVLTLRSRLLQEIVAPPSRCRIQ